MAPNSGFPALWVTCMSITSLVSGVTSTNVPRIQCTSPTGERMQTSNAPPTRISTLASGTAKVSGQNQFLTWSAELQALKTVSRLAWKTRESLSGCGCCMAAAFFASVNSLITISFAVRRFQILAEPIEAVLPLDPPGVDPLLGLAERLRLDGAGAHPTNLLRSHEARVLQHAEVLHHRRQRHRERPSQLTDRSWSTAQPLYHRPARQVGEGMEQVVEIGRLVKHMPKYHVADS